MQLNYIFFKMLKCRVIAIVLVAIFVMLHTHSGRAQSPDKVKEAFYQAMSSEDLSLINEQLEVLEQLGENSERAYKGALLMKKAALLDQPGEKLSVFKSGRQMLDSAIAAAPGRAELRFLRIMIQENAPKILGYDKDLADDAKMVSDSFHALSPEVKNAVILYSKNSNVLNTID